MRRYHSPRGIRSGPSPLDPTFRAAPPGPSPLDPTLRAAPPGPSPLDPTLRATLAAAATLLACTSALALYGGYEQEGRTFGIGKEYFVDEASYQPLPSLLEEWYEAELRPGGARGWRLSYGSLNTYDALVDQELKLEYPFQPPWSLSFRYEQGDRPSGRYERAWVGTKARFDSGWSAGLSATPEGDKEFADLAFALGREAPAGDGARLRWEARLILTDCWYNPKNDENASFAWTPLDLQLSVVGSWGSSDAPSWISLEVDRDLPFEKTYGARSDLPLDDPNQSYVFSFDNFEAKARALFRLSAENKLLARLVVLSADRSRENTALGDAALNWDDEYDLWLAGVEWWRRLDARRELAFGFEFVDFDECTRRPNDPGSPGAARDRTEIILCVRHRKRVTERLYLTTSLWQDFHDRTDHVFPDPGERETRSESKLDFALEMPRRSEDGPHGRRTATRLVAGLYVELDAPGGGGYVHLWTTF